MIADLVSEWDAKLRTKSGKVTSTPNLKLPGIATYTGLHEYLRFLATNVFDDFERDLAPGVSPFLTRLDEWINAAASDADKRILFESIFSVRYISRNEVNALYHIAYRGHLTRWQMDQIDFDLRNGAPGELRSAMRETWIGAASDSFHLDSFFHVTEAPSATERRPAWLDLSAFGDVDRIRAHIQQRHIKRIVIFEDFVGSGTQIKPALDFVSQIDDDLQVYVCPIFACRESFERLTDIISLDNVTYDPVVVLSGRNLVPRDPPEEEEEHLAELRACLGRIEQDLGITPAHGFRGVGALLVQYSNTPDNCPAILWSTQGDWSGLFPRKPRGGYG